MESVIQSCLARVFERLRSTTGPQAWALWFSRTRFVELKRGRLTLATPNILISDWIRDHWLAEIERIATDELGSRVGVDLLVQPDLQALKARSETAVRATRPDKRRTFDEFMPTGGSRHVLMALEHFAEKPSAMFNPLMVMGPEGSGRTHLAEALAHKMHRSAAVLCTDGRAFVRDFGFAQRTRTLATFRERFLRCDVLILDDLQDLHGKLATQRELSQVLKELLARGGRFVAFLRGGHAERGQLDPMCASLCASGMVVELAPPTPTEQSTILKLRLQRGPARVPADVVELVVHRARTSLPAAELLVHKVWGFAALTGAPVTEAFLDQHWAEVRGPENAGERLVHCITAVVAERCGVRIEDLVARKKTRTLTFPRALLAWLLREKAGLTLKDIGARLGGRSHTAVHQMIVRTARESQRDPELLQIVREVDRRLVRPRG
jgi:chromosomal replication initiator protein